jgi:tripartite-type tricarboxylate transporter receptor subunit TctC
MELLQQRLGVNFSHVPYKGGAPGMLDLAAGRIDFMMLDTVSPIAYVRSAKVRPLAVAYPHRLQAFPNVPTFAEAGVPNFEVFTWHGLIAAAGTPRAELSRLSDALLKAADSADIRKRFLDTGVEPAPLPPDKLAALAKSDADLWGGVISKAGIKLDQ